MTQNEFKDLLLDISYDNKEGFSGIGIIVCNSTYHLPIFSLRDDFPDIKGSTSYILSKISNCTSKYHDGFHIINDKGELTHVAQYFSPPIVEGRLIDKSRLIGGRFIAALFGSTLEDVILTGIVSKNRNLSIFKNGVEVYFEEY